MSREGCHAVGATGQRCAGGFDVRLESFNHIIPCERCGVLHGYFRQQERWVIVPALRQRDDDLRR
jgi:hypothetical protein